MRSSINWTVWLGLWCLTPLYTTFLHNISVLSWRPVLLVEETGVPGHDVEILIDQEFAAI